MMRAFVLKVNPLGEADVIVQFLAENGGFHSALARNARKSVKRFGGGTLEPCNLIACNLKQAGSKVSPTSQGLEILLDAQLERGFEGLRKQMFRLQIATELLQLISKVTHSRAIMDDELFRLLGHTLVALESASNATGAQWVKIHFIVRFLKSQGVFVGDSKESLALAKIPVSKHSELFNEFPRESVTNKLQASLVAQLEAYLQTTLNY